VSVAPGTKLGQYEVQDFIGQGAMGLVYRAYHPDLERTGAVKVMQAITPDADSVARFRHEAQAIAKMRHPNIVDVYDFGEYQGTPYMIVEYVPGGSLATRMAHGRLNRSTALKYLHGIARGLDYAHQHGVVHRDVKPANVLLTGEEEPVLADFGLAKLLQGSSLKSMTGVTTGTPAYMAPEQVAGRQVGPAADRYSLATIAYEMLTGVIPFDGEALMELLYAQVHREPMPPSSRYPDLGPDVDSVIMRGLAKDPAARWESCTAFVDALETALVVPAPNGATMLMGSPVASTVPVAKPPARKRAAARLRPTTVVVPPPTSVVDVAPTVPGAAISPRSPRRRLGRRSLIGLAAALLLVLALGVCAIAANATTLSVNPSRVAPGGTVHVTASHVPANQAGEIQLHSVVHSYTFLADSSGKVAMDITVPNDIDAGMHAVKICWNNACYKDAALRVVTGTATLPSPSSPASVSPTPISSPTNRPTTSPTSSPTSQPTAQPPKSTPTPKASVTLSSVSQLGNTSVTFHYFYGGSTKVFVCQNGTCRGAGTVSVGGGSNAPVSFKTPAGILVGSDAYVVAECCAYTNAVRVGV
jgi:Protein kinase domain